jgi:WD40 repeat protein
LGTQSNPSIAANGNKVAVAWEEYRSDNIIKVWNAAGSFVRNITGHRGAVTDAEFSPDGAYIASGSEDAIVKIWNAGTGTLVRNITAHTDKVMAVNWSADGTKLATGSFDHDIAIINTADFSVITKLNSTNGNLTRNFVNAISFSPDSSRIAAAYNGRYGDETPTGLPSQFFNLTVWKISDKSSWTRNELNGGHSYNSVTDTAFSHNGTFLASSSKDNTVKLWNSSSGALFRSANLGTDVMSLSWSPDDRHVAAGLDNGSIALVNISNTADVSWMAGSHTGRVNSIDWGVPGNGILSGASDPNSKIWFEEENPMFGLERMNLTGHTNSVYSVDWSSNGLLMLTAGGTSTR